MCPHNWKIQRWLSVKLRKPRLKTLPNVKIKCWSPVNHEDKKDDVIEVKQVDFLISDDIFKCKTGSNFFIVSMLFPTIVFMKLECLMFKVCEKILQLWFLILNYYKTRGRVFFNGGENDTEKRRLRDYLLFRDKYIVISILFTLLFRDKYIVIGNYIFIMLGRLFYKFNCRSRIQLVVVSF